ncbi:MAG: L,D-transpeptidase family protein [Dehalococcoidia bacterium]
MARLRSMRAGSWPVLAGVGLLTVAAWGFYAWRFAGSGTPQADRAEVDAVADGSSPTEATRADGEERITPLRAARPEGEIERQPTRRRPAAEHDRLPGDRSLADRTADEAARGPAPITVNAPPSWNREIEMTVGHVQRRPTGSPRQALRAGRSALARGDLVSARISLSAALTHPLAPSEATFARGELQRLADALLFSRTALPDDALAGLHVVSGGETLGVVARAYDITPELLASINQLADPDRINVGDRLKVIHGPFHARIDKSDHRMDLVLDDILIRSFQVGLGTNGGTPVGTWTVRTKLVNPGWTDPATGQHYFADDPDNPIGERWIGLHGETGECVGRVGFGIHGTIDAASIGENFSMGCIRLLPEDVAVVYDLLVSGHSRVIIE